MIFQWQKFVFTFNVKRSKLECQNRSQNEIRIGIRFSDIAPNQECVTDSLALSLFFRTPHIFLRSSFLVSLLSKGLKFLQIERKNEEFHVYDVVCSLGLSFAWSRRIYELFTSIPENFSVSENCGKRNSITTRLKILYCSRFIDRLVIRL